MKDYDKFYLITILTTFIVRLVVWLKPVASPTISGFRFHHWMYGAIGIVLCLFIAPLRKSILALGISLGVFMDEAGYILINGKTHEDNYSPMSFILIMMLELVLFICRKQIVKVYNSIGKNNKED